MSLVVSIVSHGHGEMLRKLVKQVLRFSEITKVVITFNIQEEAPDFQDERVDIVVNSLPKGFGANHNAAFHRYDATYFCVLNPDIVFTGDPFPALLSLMNDEATGLVAPMIVNSDGCPEDSMRRFPTPWFMLKRICGFDSGVLASRQNSYDFAPDWVAGMFMLFRSEAYAKVGGFDERYFMYCEDADICTRLWNIGYKVVGCLSARVIHDAQRASHRNLKHLSWHVRSMARYFLSHSFSLPSKNAFIQPD